MQEAGQPTQSGCCHGNHQMGKQGGGVNKRFTGSSSPAGLLAWTQGIRGRRKPGQAKPRDQSREEEWDTKKEVGKHLKCDLGQKQKEEGYTAVKTQSGTLMGGTPRPAAHCVYTDTHIHPPVHACLYVPKTFCHLPRLPCASANAWVALMHTLNLRHRPRFLQIGTVSRQTQHNTPVS